MFSLPLLEAFIGLFVLCLENAWKDNFFTLRITFLEFLLKFLDEDVRMLSSFFSKNKAEKLQLALLPGLATPDKKGKKGEKKKGLQKRGNYPLQRSKSLLRRLRNKS